MTIERTRWGLILLIWLAGLGAAAQYGKISVVFYRMEALYPGAGPWLGFTVSMVAVLGILFGILAGAVVAAIGFRRALVGALWIGAGMSGLQALELSFGLFLLSRAIEGLSHLGLVVAAPTLIAQISAERHRGAAMTLWGTFFGVSFTLLAWFGLPLVDHYGVRGLFAAHALIMAALALILHRALRSVPALPRQEMPRLAALPGLHMTIYRSPWMSAPAAGWLFYTACFVSILTVIPPFIAPEWRGFVVGAMPLASILSSMSIGVLLLRYLRAVQVVQLGFGLSALAMLWLWAMPGDPAACLVLAASMGLIQGASFAAIPQLNSTVVDRAYAQGALAQTGNLGNGIGTPLMVALLTLSGYWAMAGAVTLLLLSGLLVHLFLARLRAAG
ncbi:MFS transporter [Ruegeria sp. 2012CJ41-6]|uniref:MFS transporter n=1 Tax=Ruegeria spongiae TaxID=2942209 RepID=A0ABT0PZL9_9RHOB|nr:MFS transporter [Ruegeria spongiae]MCL6283074.1 MFS transporter [Ruegeria spongiae]